MTVTNTDNDDPLPVITMSVSPSSVSEEGTANLVFSFTRTGNSATALNVSYSVGGTATEGVDYANLPGAGTSIRTIAFGAGASTVTVLVDPTPDSLVETDETVAITLLAGSGYDIGTQAPVVGTITNHNVPIDEPPKLADATTVGSITSTSAVLGGEVQGDGTLPVTERGFALIASDRGAEPTLGLVDVSRLPGTGGVGPFSVSASGLKPGTQYRFRAYAINAAGTRYSAVNTFRTLEANDPVANAAEVVTAAETPVEVSLTATDPSGKPLTYSIVAPPTHGKLGSISGNRVTYTPNAGFRGDDRFTFRVDNGSSVSAPAAIAVTVVSRPSLEVGLRNDDALNLGVRAPQGMRVIIESQLPHVDWQATGQEVIGQGETNPVSMILPIPPGEPARVWRARWMTSIDPEPEPKPLPKVEVLVGFNAFKEILYTINGTPSPDGVIRVLAGGTVNFTSRQGTLTVLIEPVRVRGTKLPFTIGTVASGDGLRIAIPSEAADQDEYKYSVTIDDGKGLVIHHDPPLRVFR